MLFELKLSLKHIAVLVHSINQNLNSLILDLRPLCESVASNILVVLNLYIRSVD